MTVKLDERMRAYAEHVQPNAALVEKTLRQMEAVTVQTPVWKNRRRPLSRLAPILAVLALFVIVGGGIASASGLLPQTAEAFGRLFGSREEQTALIERMAEPVADICVNGGISVTATAELLDQKLIVVQVKVSREDGEALVPVDAEGFEGVYFGSLGSTNEDVEFFERMDLPFWFPGYQPGDTEAYDYICLRKTSDSEVNALNLGMRSLGAVYNNDWHSLADDNEASVESGWELSVPVSPSAEGRTLAAGTGFQANGHTFRIDGIHVSPMALLAEYTVVSTTPSENAIFEDRAMENGEVRRVCVDNNSKLFWTDIGLALKLKDGRVIDLSTWSADSPEGTILNPFGTIETNLERDVYIAHRGGLFMEMIPYEEMDCVLLNGAEYPVN